MLSVYLLSPLVEVQLCKSLGLLRPPGVNILGEFGVLLSALGTFPQWKCPLDLSFPHKKSPDLMGLEASFYLNVGSCLVLLSRWNQCEDWKVQHALECQRLWENLTFYGA